MPNRPRSPGGGSTRRTLLILSGLLFLAALPALLPSPASGHPVFNVLHYGVRPNDGAEDFTKVSQVISTAAAAGGGTVYFPCGTYTSGTSFWKGVVRIAGGQDNLWIKGENAGCVIFETHPLVADGVALASVCSVNSMISLRRPAGGSLFPMAMNHSSTSRKTSSESQRHQTG